jgi:hypothetical protein
MDWQHVGLHKADQAEGQVAKEKPHEFAAVQTWLSAWKEGDL